MFILVNLDSSTVYPYGDAKLRRDNPMVSFPREMNDALRAEHRVYPVQSAAQPTPPDERTSYVEGQPVLVDGVWTQVWNAWIITMAGWRATLNCSSFQFRRALRQRAIRAEFDAWLATASENHRDYLTHSNTIRRTHAAIEALRVGLGATQAQVDDVFTDARPIE